jgi:hypothetical protein
MPRTTHYSHLVVTRKNWRTDTIYVEPDGSAFVTPDGVGAYFYDSQEQAEAEYVDWDRIAILEQPADLDNWA